MKKGSSKILTTCLLALSLATSACNQITKYEIKVTNGTGGGNFELGASVTITADPAPQYQVFDYWECGGQGVSKDNPYTFIVRKSATYTAIYKSSQAKIEVINGTGGGTFNLGSSVTITADSAPQYQTFSHWEVNGQSVSTANPYTFTVTGDMTFTAKYKAQQATITVVNGTGGGAYDINSTATITADPAPQYQTFSHWEVDGQSVSTANPYSFKVTKDATYTAKYKALSATLVVKNGLGSGTYNAGSEVTVEATPTKSQTFDHWEIDGQVVSTVSPYTFTLAKDTTIVAVMYRGEKRTDTTPININTIDVNKGGTITVDYKYLDPVADKDKGIPLYFGSDDTNRFGEYMIFPDRLAQTYTGITFTALDDGYQRLTVCAGQLNEVSVSSKAPTTINRISFGSFTATKGVYFAVKSTPVVESATPRGIFNKSGNYNPIDLPQEIKVSDGGTITVDYKYVDPVTDESNGVSFFFGSDDTHRFGNYKLFHDRLEKTYDGITFTTLDDGYHRMTVCVSKLNLIRSGEEAPTNITQISFKWFEATQGIYFDINPDDKVVKTTEFTMKDSQFVIANFTDIHVDKKELLDDNGTVGKTIKYGIQKSNPDIMVICGDIAGSANDLGYIFKYLDQFEIPYFLILGNHDHEGSLGYNTIETYANQSQYGYIEKGPEDFTNHFGNYTIKIKNNQDQLVHSLILMGTGNKYTITDETKVDFFTGTKVTGVKYGSFNGKPTYCDGTKDAGVAWDGIRGDQITWYQKTAADLKCETSLICHAGFNEYVKAFEQYQDAVNKKDQAAIDACKPIGKCQMGEQICGTVEKTGLFDAIKAAGTKNVICGHDHLNDFSLLYQGVRLTYCLKTGEGAYWEESGNTNGYTELTIDSAGATSLEQMYFNPLI